MVRLRIFMISAFLYLCFNSFSAVDIPYFTEIDSINSYFHRIENAYNDNQKENINDHLITYFINFLEKPESFDANYDSLTYVSVLRSDDNLLNVFTWNLYFEDGSYKYFGFLQYKYKDQIKVYTLNDKKYKMEEEDEGITRHFVSNMEWYGALYYELITKKHNSATYYTLIGWDGADFLINRKIIEVLKFDKYGLPSFGGKAFKTDKSTTGRLIFEYADRAAMMLRYNKKEDMIVMDHLAPSEERYRDMTQYYGPDYSYDGLKFVNGRWTLVADIDANIAIPYQKNKKINEMKRRGASSNF